MACATSTRKHPTYSIVFVFFPRLDKSVPERQSLIEIASSRTCCVTLGLKHATPQLRAFAAVADKIRWGRQREQVFAHDGPPAAEGGALVVTGTPAEPQAAAGAAGAAGGSGSGAAPPPQETKKEA